MASAERRHLRAVPDLPPDAGGDDYFLGVKQIMNEPITASITWKTSSSVEAVAVQKPKRKRQPSKVWRPRRKPPRKRKPDLTWQQEYERVLILMDMRALGGTATVEELMEHQPMRYHDKRLYAALIRMFARRAPKTTIYGTGWRHRIFVLEP